MKIGKYERTGWAILNRYNSIWDGEIFETKEAARDYLLKVLPTTDMDHFSLVRASKTIEAITPPGEPEIHPMPEQPKEYYWLKAHIIPGSDWVKVSKEYYTKTRHLAGLAPSCVEFESDMVLGYVGKEPPKNEQGQSVWGPGRKR